MPRKSENRRVDIVFSPEQYKVLLNQAEQEGYITLLPEDDALSTGRLSTGRQFETSGSVAEFLRDHLSWTIPEFAQAAPLKARGKYERKQRETEPRYVMQCPISQMSPSASAPVPPVGGSAVPSTGGTGHNIP